MELDRKQQPKLIFLPDYVVKPMERAGITLEVMSMSTSDYAIESRLAPLLSNISTIDLLDAMDCNRTLSYYFIGETNSNLIDEAYYNRQDYLNRNSMSILNMYQNKNIDSLGILMSGNNSKNELYEIVNYNSTFFVIIHDGFTNSIIANDIEFKRQFSIVLMDYMFKRLGEETAVKTNVFKRIIRLLNRKNK